MYKVQHDYQDFWTTIIQSKDMVSCMLSSVMFSKLHECDRNYRVVDDSDNIVSFETKRMKVKALKGSIGKEKFVLDVYDHKNISFLTIGSATVKGTFKNWVFTSDDGKFAYKYDAAAKQHLILIINDGKDIGLNPV